MEKDPSHPLSFSHLAETILQVLLIFKYPEIARILLPILRLPIAYDRFQQTKSIDATVTSANSFEADLQHLLQDQNYPMDETTARLFSNKILQLLIEKFKGDDLQLVVNKLGDIQKDIKAISRSTADNKNLSYEVLRKFGRRLDLLDELFDELQRRRAPHMPFEHAFCIDPSGSLLRREQLSKRDIEDDQVIKPETTEFIVKCLKNGKNVALEGTPGTGKSGLSAWVDYILTYREGLTTAAFFGREPQNKDSTKLLNSLTVLPGDSIVIIDDIHLIDSVFPIIHKKLSHKKLSFLLIGRHPRVFKAVSLSRLPRMNDFVSIYSSREKREKKEKQLKKDRKKYSFTITTTDCSDIARLLAHKHASSEIERTRILDISKGDLVLTKWMLEEKLLLKKKAYQYGTPREIAADYMEEFRSLYKDDLLRLFLVLAAFRWLEIPCPYSFLRNIMKFDGSLIEEITKRINEAEYGSIDKTGELVQLLRHPSLCELFIESNKEMGQTYRNAIIYPLCSIHGFGEDLFRDFRFAYIILGLWIAEDKGGFDQVQNGLIYAEREKDFTEIARAAARIKGEIKNV